MEQKNNIYIAKPCIFNEDQFRNRELRPGQSRDIRTLRLRQSRDIRTLRLRQSRDIRTLRLRQSKKPSAAGRKV